ncbi:hypothetical protein Taro_042982 [Colocasia esculenta]|uniref:Uncharacterized protein n=1 Tax=Colocasia esculenta TaxID=4460 RepID=A0A843WI94_COLES|nr:hypothetical protein [Colocasia esculenta]
MPNLPCLPPDQESRPSESPDPWAATAKIGSSAWAEGRVLGSTTAWDKTPKAQQKGNYSTGGVGPTPLRCGSELEEGREPSCSPSPGRRREISGMTDRRDWGGGGDDPEESTQRMIERIWESLTDIRARMDQ